MFTPRDNTPAIMFASVALIFASSACMVAILASTRRRAPERRTEPSEPSSAPEPDMDFVRATQNEILKGQGRRDPVGEMVAVGEHVPICTECPRYAFPGTPYCQIHADKLLRADAGPG